MYLDAANSLLSQADTLWASFFAFFFFFPFFLNKLTNYIVEATQIYALLDKQPPNLSA